YVAEAWVVFAVASAVMVFANAVADRRDPLGGVMHAVVPIVAMLVWHVIIHGRPAEDIGADIEQLEDNVSADGEVHTNGRQAIPNRVRVERLLARYGTALTADMVQLRLGVSRRHASRLLAEVRRPQLVAAE